MPFACQNIFLKKVASATNEKVHEPVIGWHNRPARGYTSLKICTWDRPGLFTTISGSLASVGLNILSARVFSRTDGIIIDTFFVINSNGGLANRSEKDKFSKLIKKALLPNSEALFEQLTEPAGSKPDSAEWKIPTRIRIDTQSVESRTIVEVESEDQIGLLHRISRVLTQHDLSIHVARISTEKGAAIDTFYVRTKDGEKLTDSKQLKRLKKALENELL